MDREFKYLGKIKAEGDHVHRAYKYKYSGIAFQTYVLGRNEWYISFDLSDQTGSDRLSVHIGEKFKYTKFRHETRKIAILVAIEGIDTFKDQVPVNNNLRRIK